MNQMIKDLLSLAGVSKDDDLSRYDLLPSGIKEAFQEELELNRKESSRKVAKYLLDIMNSTDAEIESIVSDIRKYRKLIRDLKGRLDRLNKSKDLALTNNNFLPLLDQLGALSYQDKVLLLKDYPQMLEVPNDRQ